MDNKLTEELQQRLAELQEIFHQQLPGKLDEIASAWQKLQQEWSDQSLTHLHRLCHSLAGSGGTFGAHEISSAARQLEQQLKAIIESQQPPGPNVAPQIEQLLAALDDAAARWIPHHSKRVVNQIADTALDGPEYDNLVYVVEDDPLSAQRIQHLLLSHHYQVECYDSPAAFAAACQKRLPAVVIMDMVFAEGDTAGAAAVAQLPSSAGHAPGIIFISIRADIEARLAAMRAGAQRYLTKPLDMQKLLLAVDHLSGRRSGHPYRVLIIDDDDTIAQYHSEILESHGIETHIINNPLMTLEAIERYQPELLLLDIYMEECSGTELAAVIRQDDNLAHISIVFLSEELDMGHQLAALNLGGDEFITKPVNPDYLVKMLEARLARTRNINELNQQLQQTMQELAYQQLAIDEHAIVSITDTDGIITYVNNKFCEHSKYPREELLGSSHRLIKSGDHPPGFYQKMWQTISRGDIWHGIMKNRAKDGSVYWADTTIVPFLNPQGVPYKYVSVRSDLTPQMEIQQEIEAARYSAERANRAKSQFLSSMSHELRTPMNAILGFAQLLQMEGLNTEQREWVGDIIKGGRHLLTLINDILDLSKIEAGHIQLSPEPVQLNELLGEISKLLAPLLEERQIRLRLQGCSRAVVRADRTRLKQVLLNLLSNAIKYNHQHGSIQVSCGNDAAEGFTRLEVHDTGPGIPAELHAKLFEPFQRLFAEGSSIEGSGIGLTICKNLVEIMGGQIGVQSQPGHGATFWVELPTTPLPSLASVSQTLSQEEDLAARPERVYDVLYIEDNPVNLKLVRMVLGRHPHLRLQSAHEPYLGLELARTHIPDLILLDINLPGIDGYEVLSRLRAERDTAHIPVIAVSANALKSDLQKGRECGFNEYVTKPINVQEFTQTIDRVLKVDQEPPSEHE